MEQQQIKARIKGLLPYLPPGGFELLVPYFARHRIHLRITRDRKTKMGDYRHPSRQYPVHRISVNGTLNPYSFLITLIHEIAHLETFVQYRNRVAPHGKEWQFIYGRILEEFLNQAIFPSELEQLIQQRLQGLKASTCSDPVLYKALKAYDTKTSNLVYVEDLAIGDRFRTEGGHIFVILKKARTRYHCQDLKSKRIYTFSSIAEVEPIREG